MKECFLITTYCETEEKLHVLKSTIENVKKFNKDIIIHAHYPLSIDIQNDVNYYLSSDNFDFNKQQKLSWYWKIVGNYKLFNWMPIYTYGVLKMLYESFIFLSFLDYDVVHVLNYDSNIDENLYLIAKQNYNKSTFYENILYKGQINAIWYSIVKTDFKYFINLFNYDTYSKSDGISIENYLGEYIFNNSKFNFINLNEYDYKQLYKCELSVDGTYRYENLEYSEYSRAFDIMFINNNFTMFGGNFNKNLAFLFYDIKESVDIHIQIFDKIFDICSISNSFFIDTGINIEKLKPDDIYIIINKIPINKLIINQILKNNIELK